MKKTAILLALTIITGVMFSACTLLQTQEDEGTTVESTESEGTAVPLSVTIKPAKPTQSKLSIPLAVVIK